MHDDTRTQKKWLPFLLFFVVLVLYQVMPSYRILSDTTWALPTALSLIHEGNADLNEFSTLVEESNYYAIQTIDGNYYNFFPVGTSVLVAPPLFVIDSFLHATQSDVDIYQQAQTTHLDSLNRLLASLVVAGASVAMFLVARLYVSRWKALIVWCVFAFGTAAWSVAALGLWMHGPTVFLLGFALYFSLSALPERGFGEWRLFVCGFLIAFAYIVRPSNAIWVLIFSAYMVWHFRMRAILFMSGAAVVAIPFLLYNISVYESILPSYYEGSRLQFHTAFLEALIANLISPSRGLFFYTPVLIFAIGGAILRIRAGLWRLFDSLLAGGMVAHWLAISAFPHWWGGFSNGPRFMIDILPFLCLWLAYFLRHFEPKSSAVQWGTLSIFALLTFISVFIHYSGATSGKTMRWSSVPVNVGWLPDRLWDWQDVSFLRPYRNLEDIVPGARVNAYRVEFDAKDIVVSIMHEWYPVQTTADGRTYRMSASPEPSFILPMETDEMRDISVGLVNVDEPGLTENFQLYVNDVQIPLMQTQTDPPVFSGVIPPDVLANRRTQTVFDFRLPASGSDSETASDAPPPRIAVDYVQIGPPDETLPRELDLPD